MEKVSDRLARLSGSATIAMNQRSNDLKSQGIDVINLSVGEPDFNSPDHIKEAAKKAVDDNYSFYPPVPGYPVLRKAIVEKLKNQNDLDYTVDQIVVSSGAKHSIVNVLLCLINEGDEVIIPAPYWVSYPEQVKIADGTPVIIDTDLENDFKATPEQIERICSIIMATKLPPKPKNLLENIICDSDLDYLGRSDFIPVSNTLYEELRAQNKMGSLNDWNKIQVKFISGHQYFTRTARSLREVNKQLQIERIQSLITE